MAWSVRLTCRERVRPFMARSRSATVRYSITLVGDGEHGGRYVEAERPLMRNSNLLA